MKKKGYNKIVILITVGLLLAVAVFIYTLRGEAEKYKSGISSAITIEQTWRLPSILEEVSGIAFLESGRLACVQDEKGTVFIYDLKTSRIEQEVEFAGNGDFEGIAIAGDTVFTMESNGTIHKIENFPSTAQTSVFQTFFTSKNDMEGLFYDKTGNRLLLAVKEADPNSKDQKGIYALDLASMQVNQTPVYRLTFEEEIFNNIRKNDKGDTFFPSEVAINPLTGEILVLEAREPRLLILEPSGVPKAIHRLSPKEFPKPEGLAFDASGSLYISNEGKPATIHRVSLNQK